MDKVQQVQPLPEPTREDKAILCDLCEMAGLIQEDTSEHALGHCDQGQHCIATTASCAMDYSNDDHSPRCHECKTPFSKAT